MNTKPLLTLAVVIVLALALSAAATVVLPVAGGTGVAGTITGIPYANGTGAYTAATQAQAITLLGTPASCPFLGSNASSQFTCPAGTVGGIIGGSAGAAGLFAGSTFSWFATGSAAANLALPYNFYLNNLSANIYTTISSNGTAQWLLTGLPSATTVTPAIITFPPGATQGTNVPQNSLQPPIPIPAWTTTDFTRSAAALTGAATGGVGIFSAEVLGTTIQPLGSYLNGTIAITTTSYIAFSSAAGVQSTEGQAGVVIPWANGGTLGDFVGYTSGAQPASGALVGTLRVNGASPASGPTFTVALSAAAGIYPDLTHTASVTQGQWVDVQLANAASAAVSATVIGVTAALTPVAPATGIFIFPVVGTAVASGYYSPFVLLESTTEAEQRGPVPRAGTIKNLYCIYTTPPGTNAGAFTLVKNGTPQSLSVAIPTTGSGVQIQSDTTAGHAVTVAAFDQVDVEYTQTSGTKPVVGSCSAEFD